MKTRSIKIPIGSKITLVAVIMVVIPIIVLCCFGIRLSLRQQYMAEKTLVDGYNALLKTKADEIERSVQELESSAKKSIDSGEFDNIHARLIILKDENPLVEQIFFLNPDGHLAFPRAKDKRGPRKIKSEAGDEDRIVEDYFREAGKYEFGEKDIEKAIEYYGKCINSKSSPRLRAKALFSLASCYFKLKKYDMAASQYEKLITEHSNMLELSNPYLLLTAQYQMAKAKEELNNRRGAMEGYLSLYEGIISGRFLTGDEEESEYFKIKLKVALAELMKNTVLPSTFKERFEKAKQEEFKSRKEKEFLEVLNKWLVVKLRLDTARQVSEAGRFKHFYENIHGKPYQIAYTPIYEDERYAGILGFKIALGYISSEILAKVLSSLTLSGNLTISVLDETGKPIYGPNPASRESITSENFSNVLPFWRIAILQTGGISIRDMAKKQSQVYIALMVLMIALICIGTCLTLRNVLREIQLSRMKSDFVSNVSHELKTPLALIRLFGETLEMGRVETKEKAQEYYRVIIRECDRLTQLINNVLNFSRIDSAKEHYEFEYVDMAGVVQDVVDTYKFQLDKEGFEVETEIDRDIPMALIDKDAISQVISNLVDNAIKFSKDEKKLTVNLKREEKSILIEVIDSGVGIDKKEQEKIFGKFYRVRDGLAGETKGSGLGLTLVKHIVEAHNGKIIVASDKGSGSKFSILIPAEGQKS